VGEATEGCFPPSSQGETKSRNGDDLEAVSGLFWSGICVSDPVERCERWCADLLLAG